MPKKKNWWDLVYQGRKDRNELEVSKMVTKKKTSGFGMAPHAEKVRHAPDAATKRANKIQKRKATKVRRDKGWTRGAW